MPILTELHIYPIKSCAGIALREATLTTAGLMSQHIYDREWMVVDEEGNFLSQRTHPRMALIRPRLLGESMELRAPGMLPLRIPLDLPAPEDAVARTVQVWDDQVLAYDCDAVTATWFSNAVGAPCRLVRFHAEAKRAADPAWAGEIEAPTLFADGYPLLVISEASLQDLNAKGAAAGRAPLPMDRFRPNIVLSGLEAFEEDYASSLSLGQAILKPVKPCARCRIPSIDQETGERGPNPLDLLQAYRANPKIDGGLAFGMNTVVQAGAGEVLRVGQEVGIELAF